MRHIASISPVVLALLLHGFVSGRLWLAIPVAIVAAVGLYQPPRWTWSAWGGWSVAALGGGLGWLAGQISDVPSGPFPPLALSVVMGALMGVLGLLCFCGEQVIAWAVALTLVVISGHASMTDVGWAYDLAAGGFMVCIWLQVGLFWQRHRWGIVLYGAGVVGVAGYLSSAVAASQGMIASMMMELLQGEVMASGLGASPIVGLPSVSSASPQDRVVMDISGDMPEYLRSAVLDTFDGAQWQSSERLLGLAPPALGTADHSLQILFRQHFAGALPAPSGTLRMDGGLASLSHGGLVAGSANWGDVHLFNWGDSAFSDPPDRVADTAVPGGLARDIRALFAPVLMGRLDDSARASAMEHYLQSKFSYSLATDLRGNAHPLVILLQEHRPAYCVYFASAMAVGLRAEGIPARLIGGYVRNTSGFLGQQWVRERDAHAWVEAWVDGQWQVYDPTPQQPAPEATSWVQSFREIFLSALLRITAHPLETLLAILRSRPMLALVLLLATYLLVRRLLNMDRPMAGIRYITIPGADYKNYLKLLKRYGVRPLPVESDEEALKRLAERAPAEILSTAQEMLENYRRLRFGPEVLENDTHNPNPNQNPPPAP